MDDMAWHDSEQYLLSLYYIIDDDTKQIRHPVNLDEYIQWCEQHCDVIGGVSVRIAYSELAPDVDVSTIFMTLDHSFGFGPPVLYETIVFGGPLNLYRRRYHTEEEALRGHEQTVAMLRGGSHN